MGLDLQKDYLFRRPGSKNWWVRFVYPKDMHETHGRGYRKSLETADRREAEIRALPLIHEHKRKLQQFHNERNGIILTTGRSLRYPLGEHTTDAGRFIATPEKVYFLDETGQIVRTQANGEVLRITTDFEPAEISPAVAHLSLTPNKSKPVPARRNGDDAILETWIAHNNITGFLKDEARAVWSTFQTIVGKPLKDCTRDDGRKLAGHYFEQGNKSATVDKKVGHLRAAVNLAISENKLKFNPFSGVVKKVNDRTDRLPLDEIDMKLVRDQFDELSQEDRLLWVLLANTGMRLGEAWHIDEEFAESNVRFVIIGTKTDQSLRRVPLPEAVLPYLDKKISGRLFTDTEKNSGRRLNRFIRRIGIEDRRKVLHSLRHRAKDRLRANECPLDIQYQLLGHEDETVASDYGLGYPVIKLKYWLDTIGW